MIVALLVGLAIVFGPIAALLYFFGISGDVAIISLAWLAFWLGLVLILDKFLLQGDLPENQVQKVEGR